MAFEFDNNTCETTTSNTGSFDIGSLGVPVQVSSVTAVTDKAAAKATKQAEREAQKLAADAIKQAEKIAKAQMREDAKAAKEIQKAIEKAEKQAARAAAKEAKAAEKAAAQAAAEAQALAIEQAVKSALEKGGVLAKKYEEAESSKVDFKNSSRQVTYDLLVEILAYVEELDKRGDIGDVLTTMKTQLWKNWKIKTQENTSDLGVIVKYITRTKRKNAHMYARVLEEARKHKANSGNLLLYIEQRGGINKIVANSKAKSISNKKRLHNAYKRYANAVLAHKLRDGGLGKIPLTSSQEVHHYDTRDDAHFVYTFGKIEKGELVLIDFVPWVNQTQEEEFFLYHTLSTIKVPGNSSELDERLSAILHKKMAEMFDKYNAVRWKRNLPAINQFGEVASGVQPSDFSVFDWNQFEQEYAEYLSAKQQQQS
jgi:hypothetical protein